jgi:hypothetical protein
MPTGLSNEKYRRPSIAFQDILRKGSGGVYREKGEYSAFMFRAVVIAVDTIGGRLETPTGKPHKKSGDKWVEGGKELEEIVREAKGPPLAKYSIVPNKGPVNPANSIKARIISNNMDQFISDDDLRCYWPMFPGISNISAGEMVYVVFEDEDFTHGLWLAKVPTNNPNQTSNQILKGQLLQDVKAGKAKLYDDSKAPIVGTNANGSPIKDAKRLTKLYMGR